MDPTVRLLFALAMRSPRHPGFLSVWDVSIGRRSHITVLVQQLQLQLRQEVGNSRKVTSSSSSSSSRSSSSSSIDSPSLNRSLQPQEVRKHL